MVAWTPVVMERRSWIWETADRITRTLWWVDLQGEGGGGVKDGFLISRLGHMVNGGATPSMEHWEVTSPLILHTLPHQSHPSHASVQTLSSTPYRDCSKSTSSNSTYPGQNSSSSTILLSLPCWLMERGSTLHPTGKARNRMPSLASFSYLQEIDSQVLRVPPPW